MTLQEQLINDIKHLPDDILQDLSYIVKKLLVLNNKVISIPSPQNVKKTNLDDFSQRFPLLGCAEGKVWIADDFDAPMKEMEDYM